jgi:hypothetical protein
MTTASFPKTVRTLALFVAQGFHAARRREVSLAALVRILPRWLATQDGRAQPLDLGLPWLTFGAIDFLERTVRGEDVVCEFGSGASSVFFGKRVRQVVSVEHDVSWSEQVRAVLTSRGITNCEVRTVPPNGPTAGDPAEPFGYASSDEAYAGQSFQSYASAVDDWPDMTFDIGLVDGRARPSCYAHLREKVRIGGILILDNAERSSYVNVLRDARARGWPERSFTGPCPYSPYFTTTMVWTRTN